MNKKEYLQRSKVNIIKQDYFSVLLVLSSFIFVIIHRSEKPAVGIVMGSFREAVLRKAVENTVKHHSGGVASVVANHHGDDGNLLVVMTLLNCRIYYVSNSVTVAL